jgi:uncharacterized protein
MKKNAQNFHSSANTFMFKLIEHTSHSSFKSKYYFFIFSFFLPFLGKSQVSITSSTPYTQDFNTLVNSGTSSILPTGWFLSEANAGTGTGANTTYTAGTGSGTAGETYSFGSASSTDRAFGGLQSGSLIPTIGAAFTNNTGSTISTLAIAYTGEQWRIGALGRVDRLDFQYSTDATSLTTGTWTDLDALDFVAPVTIGTVGVLDGNAAANRTAKSSSISSLTLINGSTIWFRWNDFNATGSDDGLGIDDFSLTPTIAVSGLPNISISDANVTEGNSGTTNMTFTISLTAPAPLGGVTYDIATSNGTASSPTDYVAQSLVGQRIAEGVLSTTFTVVINGDVDYEIGETVNVTLSNVINANIADGLGVGTITNDDAPTYVKISSIQGAGTTAALTGLQHIEGIVTRTFLGSSKLNGFFVQEEDADMDGNPLTSEGIFVFDQAGLFSGVVGDKVQVSGTVIDFATGTAGSSVTEMTSLIGVTVLSSGNALPTVTNVQLPVTNVSDLERFEGMLVNVSASSGNLTVTETFGLHQYGQVLLSSTGSSNQPGTDARIDQFTQFNAPSVAGNTSYQLDIAKRLIYLDDGSGITYPSTHIFGRSGNPLSASNTLREGDEVATITAILDHRFEGYRLQTTTGVNFLPSNARPTTPSSVGGTLKAGSFNVLNYFSTPTYPTARGATTAVEFTRQRDKIIQSILLSGVDIMGLNELEDNGNAAVQNLVNGLNAIAGAGTYNFINAGDISDDLITVGMIYKPSIVTPTGAAAAIPFTFGNGSFNVVNRRSLAQTFTENSSGAIFTLVANHFKSKGSSSGGLGDADAGDGQAASNGTRTRQAQDLLAWLATKPTGTNDPDYLIVGDLNAYAMEDPLTTLSSGGFTAVLPNTSYSYAFSGQFGSLDHALVNSSLSTQITGATKWHINSDEPTVLDYNTENKTVAQQAALYNADQFRTSDHDPVIVGLSLIVSLPVELVQFTGFELNGKIRLNWTTATETNSSHFEIERSISGEKFEKVGEIKAKGSNEKKNYVFDDAKPNSGLNYYRLKMVDKDATYEYSKTITIDFSNSDVSRSIKIYPNPTSSVLNIENAENFKTVKFYNTQGLLVLQSNQLLVNVSALNIGLYLVEVENTEGIRTLVRFFKN